MINIILADHQPIFRTVVARTLAIEDDIRIVGQPLSPIQMMNAARSFRPHVVMLTRPFLEVLPELSKVAREQHIALMMLAEKEDTAGEYAGLGLRGVIYRSAEPSVMVKAVRRLAGGEKFIQSGYPAQNEVEAAAIPTALNSRLTPMELRIIQAVTVGLKNREIANRLKVSEQSVKNALGAIFQKLGIADRLELALYVLCTKA